MRNVIIILLMGCLTLSPLTAEDFLPEDGKISESQILVRMHKELGEEITSNKNGIKKIKNRIIAPSKRSNSREVYLELKGKNALKGKIRMPDNFIKLFKNAKSTTPEHIIQLTDVSSIVFSDWKMLLDITRPDGKKRKYFFATVCTIYHKNGEKYSGAYDQRNWLQIKIRNKTTVRNFRTYYTHTENLAGKIEKSTKSDLLVGLNFKSAIKNASMNIKGKQNEKE